jgi:hypothetical protein
MLSSRALARSAGLLYLVVAVGGAFAEAVRSSVRVPGDGAATTANIVQHATLYRLGFGADLVDFACFLVVGILLYVLLRPVNAAVATAMLTINAVSVAMQALNMLNQLGALLVATDPAYTAGMAPAAAQSLVMLLADLQHQGYVIAQVFFGGYLLPLGYLVFRSGFFPRALGVALMVGAGGYLAGVVANFIVATSGLAVYPAVVGGLAELAFLLWLIVVGARPAASAAGKEGLAWSA